MDFDIGGTDEAIDFIQTAVKANGFTAYDEYSLKINTLREIVHAVEAPIQRLRLIQRQIQRQRQKRRRNARARARA